MNTYFDVGDQRFESRERAVEQVASWNAATVRFSVQEVENTEVTRKSAKGNVITERVFGSIEKVPRVISTRKLDQTYIVLDTLAAYPAHHYLGAYRHFPTFGEAERERAERQEKADKLAALTDADIREVRVPTLEDVLERDADKIKGLETEIGKTRKEWEQLKEQASSCVASEIADLQTRIDGLRVEAAKRFGVQDSELKFDGAVQAYDKAIYFEQLEKEAVEKLLEDHSSDCWPDSGCRHAGECTYEPDADEITEYLLEHPEEFEVEEGSAA